MLDKDVFTPAVAVGEEPESNPSNKPWFTDIVERRYDRCDIVKGGVAAAVTGLVSQSALAGKDERHNHHDHDDHADWPRRRIDPGLPRSLHSTPASKIRSSCPRATRPRC
ncbi:hypothetical protein [Povalibacter sp.]|uniref:hypothetical protein n=1 Tax=Povalibacter sp. TaxID=1962978 RepID=UPI002F3EB6B1